MLRIEWGRLTGSFLVAGAIVGVASIVVALSMSGVYGLVALGATLALTLALYMRWL